VAAASFLECLGAVAREHRERVEAQLIDISFWSRAGQSTISKFERGESQPRDLDRLLVAYAKVSGAAAGELLREATERWETGGGAELPTLTPFPREPTPPIREAAESLERLAERDRQERDSTEADQADQRRRRKSR
jgi:hypothetical protein